MGELRTIRTVVELPIEQLNSLIEKTKRLTDKVDILITNSKVIKGTAGRIPAIDFARTIGVSKTTLNLMINGSHASGFVLKSFRKTGTKKVWTLASEVDRYFEGFGAAPQYFK